MSSAKPERLGAQARRPGRGVQPPQPHVTAHTASASAAPSLPGTAGPGPSHRHLSPAGEGEQTEASPDPEHDRHVHTGSCHRLSIHHSTVPTTQPHCGSLFWSPQAPQQLLLVTTPPWCQDTTSSSCVLTNTQPLHSPAHPRALGTTLPQTLVPCRAPSLQCPPAAQSLALTPDRLIDCPKPLAEGRLKAGCSYSFHGEEEQARPAES